MHVLIVKLSSLGDVIQTLPVIADILRFDPSAKIDWVVEESFAPLLEQVAGIDRVIPIAQRRWRKQGYFKPQTQAERSAFKTALRKTAYDCIIDAQGLIKSAMVAGTARLAKNGKRGSFANRSEACGYEWPVKFLLEHNQPMPRRVHAVERARLLASLLIGYGLQGAPSVTFKQTPVDSRERRRVFIAHGTTRSDNQWAFESWYTLCQQLLNAGYRLALPQANAAEEHFCNQLREKLGSSECVDILPRLSLPEILHEIHQSAGVIGVDSGLAHLAVALDKPCVQIFQHDRAWRAGPPPGTPHQIAIAGGFQGIPVPDPQQIFAAWQTVMANAPVTPAT